ncbi:MAG: hypothetical protein AB1487_08860 [Thermodesulfobacteriota bacterium]
MLEESYCLTFDHAKRGISAARYDEQAYTKVNSEAVDFRAASELAYDEATGEVFVKRVEVKGRLWSLVSKGFLAEIGTGPKDPRRVYILKRGMFPGKEK